MSFETKITFSRHELVCLHDTDFLLTKRAVGEKMQTLLVGLALALADEPQARALPPIRTKVSKGENYRGLPYWVLDYPAIFSGDDVMAYRTICRWGHEFSFTLQLAGKYWEDNRAILALKYDYLSSLDGLYLCINHTMWEHHFEADNYLPFAEVINNSNDWQAFTGKATFLKLAFKLPLDDWEKVIRFGVDYYRKLSQSIEH